MNILKRIFSKPTEQTIEEQAIERMQKIAKQISKKKGGAASLCYEFVKFCETDELFRELRILKESEVPFKKLEILVGAIQLLEASKGIEGENGELAYQMAKFCYTKSTLILNDDELQDFFLMPVGDYKEYLDKKLNKAEEAWRTLEDSPEFIALVSN